MPEYNVNINVNNVDSVSNVSDYGAYPHKIKRRHSLPTIYQATQYGCYNQEFLDYRNRCYTYLACQVGQDMKNKLEKPKDPNAPKKPQNSYFLFMNEQRLIFKQKYPNENISKFPKLMDQEWKELDNKVKQKYQQQAAELMNEYKIKMNRYKQTPEYKQYLSKLNEWKLQNAAKDDNKFGKPKDPNAPKRPQNSYFLFMNEQRPIFRQKYPNKTLSEISKSIAKEWLNRNINKQLV